LEGCRGGRVDRDSHGDFVSLVGIFSNQEVIVINESRSPLAGRGPSGDWDKFSQSGIKELKQPSSVSDDSSIHLNRESSDVVGVSFVGGCGEGDDSNVGEVGGICGGNELHIGVGVVLLSDLVGKSQRLQASSWIDGGSGNSAHCGWNLSSGWGQKGIDLSSDSSVSGIHLVISFDFVDGIEVGCGDDTREFSIRKGARNGGGGKESTIFGNVGRSIEADR